MVPHASSTPLTGRPDQEATEVLVGGEQGHSSSTLVADGDTRGGDSRPRDAAHEASEEAKLERASSACRHAGGAKVAARNLLAEPRSPRTEETWSTLVSKFPSEDHAAVSAAEAAVLASATEVEDTNAPPWHPDN